MIRNAFTLIELLVVLAILSMLALLLLPAFTAATSDTKRVSCLGQLNAMGVALETYCADYGQYFPSHPAYGATRCIADRREGDTSFGSTLWLDDGFFTDPSLFKASDPTTWTKGRVRTGGGTYGDFPATPPPGVYGDYTYWLGDSPICRNRTLFMGDKASGPNAKGTDRTWRTPQGELNMAPVGLGLLMERGYLPDVRPFFCQAANGKLPQPWNYGTHWQSKYLVAIAANSLADVKVCAGGYDAQAILRGDWFKIPAYADMRGANHPRAGAVPFYCDRLFRGHVLMSDYAYRNMPLVAGCTQGTRDVAGLLREVIVAGTQPQVKAEVGCPVFKTQKTLGGRAIAGDSFGRPREDWPKGRSWKYEQAGHGFYAHQTGYNILYGDRHATWYDDPKEVFIWWPDVDKPYYGQRRKNIPSYSSTESSGLFWYHRLDGANDVDGRYQESGTFAWHMLDMAAGIDKDVDAQHTWP